jgi:hypothetical protein
MEAKLVGDAAVAGQARLVLGCRHHPTVRPEDRG